VFGPGAKKYLRFEYTCCEVAVTTITTTTTGSCYTEQSALNDNGRSNHHPYGEIYYLDRHHVRCLNGKGLSSFTFNVQAHKVQVKWSCCTFNGDLGSKVIKKTTSRSQGDKYSLSGFLAASPVDCGPDGFVSWWHVTNRADVEYECQSIKPGETLSCSCETTPFQKQRGADYLSRHELQCTPGKVMQKWKAIGGKASTMQFEYTCCEVAAADAGETTSTCDQNDRDCQTPVYGEWCGPGHPVGNALDVNIQPVDKLDTCCQQHDRNYSQARRLEKAGNITAVEKCSLFANHDQALSDCAKKTECTKLNFRQYYHCFSKKQLMEHFSASSSEHWVWGDTSCVFPSSACIR